jgi:hypothetical protein
MFVVCYPRGEGGWTSVPVGAPQPVVSARALAEQARDEFTLPDPKPGSSPAGGTLVNLPTYLYVSRENWHPMTAKASVTGTEVTVTATPVRVDWSMGERGGTAVTCAGPGAPYAGEAGTPSCGYQYRQSSSKQLGSARPGFRVTATTTWEIRWTCAGVCDAPGGTLGPLTPAGSIQLPVFEARSQLVSSQ